ncbi:MAG: exodeoxyribonuclease III [Chitinophagaceae bacterium]
MRIISYNVNGLRAAINKGFLEWLKTDPADIICLQEIKANKENVDHTKIEEIGFSTYWYSAQKKGYSGVAVFTKIKPNTVVYGCSIEQSDYEGRVIRLDFDEVSLLNAYFPSGTSGEIRQTYKYQWLDEFLDYLNELRKAKPNLIICGDYNIAHKEIDIHDPKGNKNTTGFLPEERKWLDKFFGAGYADAFRHIHADKPHQYTWWSTRFPTVRINNKGWRIDYISVTENIKHKIKDANIYPEIKHSDHCPIYVDMKI